MYLDKNLHIFIHIILLVYGHNMPTFLVRELFGVYMAGL